MAVALFAGAAFVRFLLLLLVRLVHTVADECAADGADGAADERALARARVAAGADQPADQRPARPADDGARPGLGGATTRDDRARQRERDEGSRHQLHGFSDPARHGRERLCWDI